MKSKRNAFLVVCGTIALLSVGCQGNDGVASGGGASRGSPTFDILSGSENGELEPLLQRYAREKGVKLRVSYRGSVDIMIELQRGRDVRFDAVWPANSLWITLGDEHKVVKYEESVMHSPVIFGVRRSLAEKLGWVGRPVTLGDILQAADSGNFSFAMTSATQSNSGATAYLGFLHALAGGPDVLTHEHLADHQLQKKIKRLLGQINRSSASSGWLKDLLVQKYDQFAAMVNYESMIIEANRELTAHGQEPLMAIYPTDAITIADSPLGYVDHGEPAKEAFFRGLVEYLKSDRVQREILSHGRRAGLVGLNTSAVDPNVFNLAWGIDVSKVIAPVPLPSESVMREALELYQAGGLRKPSATAFVLDCSGSMKGEGITDLKAAMALLLDPAQGKRFLLQPSAQDIHIVVPFDAQPRAVMTARGNDPQALQQLLSQVQSLQPGGGTNIYAGVLRALEELANAGNLENYFPAVILMTDGRSDGSLQALEAAANRRWNGREIPVFSITFGEADDRQLKQISNLTGGRVFDGKKDLTRAFRDAKGYN